jgi:soluble lytic murein transglycosylase-like protein
MPGNPFGPCQDLVGSFNSWGGQTGIPAILLASIAMQESTCNPGATGPNGEIGLMQITPDKCQGNCWDAYTNIGIGAQYLKSRIDANGGNLAQAMGEYNGWFPGMTEYDANNKGSCGARNNLDYLQHVFNGYCQGVDPNVLQMGTFNNIRNCS